MINLEDSFKHLNQNVNSSAFSETQDILMALDMDDTMWTQDDGFNYALAEKLALEVERLCPNPKQSISIELVSISNRGGYTVELGNVKMWRNNSTSLFITLDAMRRLIETRLKGAGYNSVEIKCHFGLLGRHIENSEPANLNQIIEHLNTCNQTVQFFPKEIQNREQYIQQLAKQVLNDNEKKFIQGGTTYSLFYWLGDSMEFGEATKTGNVLLNIYQWLEEILSEISLKKFPPHVIVVDDSTDFLSFFQDNIRSEHIPAGVTCDFFCIPESETSLFHVSESKPTVDNIKIFETSKGSLSITGEGFANGKQLFMDLINAASKVKTPRIDLDELLKKLGTTFEMFDVARGQSYLKDDERFKQLLSSVQNNNMSFDDPINTEKTGLFKFCMILRPLAQKCLKEMRGYIKAGRYHDAFIRYAIIRLTVQSYLKFFNSQCNNDAISYDQLVRGIEIALYFPLTEHREVQDVFKFLNFMNHAHNFSGDETGQWYYSDLCSFFTYCYSKHEDSVTSRSLSQRFNEQLKNQPKTVSSLFEHYQMAQTFLKSDRMLQLWGEVSALLLKLKPSIFKNIVSNSTNDEEDFQNEMHSLLSFFIMTNKEESNANQTSYSALAEIIVQWQTDLEERKYTFEDFQNLFKVDNIPFIRNNIGLLIKHLRDKKISYPNIDYFLRIVLPLINDKEFSGPVKTTQVVLEFENMISTQMHEQNISKTPNFLMKAIYYYQEKQAQIHALEGTTDDSGIAEAKEIFMKDFKKWIRDQGVQDKNVGIVIAVINELNESQIANFKGDETSYSERTKKAYGSLPMQQTKRKDTVDLTDIEFKSSTKSITSQLKTNSNSSPKPSSAQSSPSESTQASASTTPAMQSASSARTMQKTQQPDTKTHADPETEKDSGCSIM